MANQLDYNQYNLHLDLENHYFGGYNGVDVGALYANPISGFMPNVCPPPAAFLGPKCALWDCPRPAQGSDWWQDYCSSFHASLALNEGPPGMSPVLRPGGIGLKDGLLFAALSAKVQGKDVGIPECEGAATAKSPWNAPGKFLQLVLYLLSHPLMTVMVYKPAMLVIDMLMSSTILLPKYSFDHFLHPTLIVCCVY